MEIRFRAQRQSNGAQIERKFNNPNYGFKYHCDPQTLEIVIDGQAVKVAKIRELLAMRLKIKSVIDLYYDDWSNDEIAESITKILNNIDGESND